MIAHIYTKPYCPYCVQAKILLAKKNVTLVEFDGLNKREEMVERAAKHGGTARTFPQIFFVFDDGEEYIGGYDDLSKRKF